VAAPTPGLCVDAGTTLTQRRHAQLNAGANVTGLGTLSCPVPRSTSTTGWTSPRGCGINLAMGAEFQHRHDDQSALHHERWHAGGTGAVTISGNFDVTSYSTLSGPHTHTQGISTVNMPGAGVATQFQWWQDVDQRRQLTIAATTSSTSVRSAAVQHADQRRGATLNLSSTNGTPLNFYTGRRR